MTDYIEKYKKEKFISRAGIVFLSLVLALGINFFILDGTEMGQGLKASILDVNNVGNKGDIYLENKSGILELKSSKLMQSPTNFSISIAYNPEVLKIMAVRSRIGEILPMGETNIGSDTIFLVTYGNNDVNPEDIILEIEYSKLSDTSTQVNLVNASFVDTLNDTYELTTESITF